jgi:molecular chaperone GrpE
VSSGEPREGGDRAERAVEAPDPSAEIQERLAATEDRLLRALADLDNQRKRIGREMAREREEIRAGVLADWLEVADSAERALAAFGDRADDPMFVGLAALAGQIEEALRRGGVRRFGAPGEPFDPARHEAMGTMPAGEVSPGSVAAVIRAGYELDGRLLRPAQVVVARAEGA